LIELDCPQELRSAALAALAECGISDGHLAVELVAPERIQDLNRAHRGIDTPTDVLAFPVDRTAAAVGPRELGDVVICPQYTEDLDEAVVHGVLHLAGYDHEVDSGEMLALQQRVLAGLVGDRT
jgi:probable rRNA maturation factor